MNNILLLSAGRRVELAQAFKAELITRNLQYKLLATDSNPELSAACQVVDESIKSPRVTESTYIDFLLNICKAKGAGLAVPTIDTELLMLARHRAVFAAEGINLIISDESLVSVCRDKRLSAGLFSQLGIDTPIIYDRAAFSSHVLPNPMMVAVALARLKSSSQACSLMRCWQTRK